MNSFLNRFFKSRNYMNKVDLMNLIHSDDVKILQNKRLLKMHPNDWGTSVGITNQYVQCNLLKTIYPDTYCEYEDIKNSGFNVSLTIRGFDLIFKKDNIFYKVQSKLRQVKGVTPFSCQINLSKNKNQAYVKEDFDFLFVSLVNIKYGYENRSNINNWNFSFIPVNELLKNNTNNDINNNDTNNVITNNGINNDTNNINNNDINNDPNNNDTNNDPNNDTNNNNINNNINNDKKNYLIKEVSGDLLKKYEIKFK